MEKSRSSVKSIYWVLIPILLIAFALRVWRIEAAPVLDVDGTAHRVIAVNLIEGRGYSSATTEPFPPTDFRTPLMPLFVAGSYLVFGRSDFCFMVLQAFLDLLTVVFVFRIGKKLYGQQNGLLAAFLAATYIGSIVLAASLYTEPLYFFLIVTSTYLLVGLPRITQWRLLAVGLLLGLATLTRPLTLLYPVFLLPVLWWLVRSKRQTFAMILVIGIAMMLIVGPWVIRNKLVLNRLSLSDNTFVYVNIALGAEPYFHWPPQLLALFRKAEEGTLTVDDRRAIENESLQEFQRRVAQSGFLGYVQTRMSQVGVMWFYPGITFLLRNGDDIPLKQALETRDLGNLAIRAVCVGLWGILPILLACIGLPLGYRKNPATLLLIVFAVFITIPNLILTTDWRYAAPSFFLHAPLTILGGVWLAQKVQAFAGRESARGKPNATVG